MGQGAVRLEHLRLAPSVVVVELSLSIVPLSTTMFRFRFGFGFRSPCSVEIVTINRNSRIVVIVIRHILSYDSWRVASRILCWLRFVLTVFNNFVAF